MRLSLVSLGRSRDAVPTRGSTGHQSRRLLSGRHPVHLVQTTPVTAAPPTGQPVQAIQAAASKLEAASLQRWAAPCVPAFRANRRGALAWSPTQSAGTSRYAPSSSCRQKSGLHYQMYFCGLAAGLYQETRIMRCPR